MVTIGYFYNPNTEQEKIKIMNNALQKVEYISAQQKNPQKIKGFRKCETGFEQIPPHTNTDK